MKILIVTDAWYPQVNGVVRTLETVRGELGEMGHDVHVISPDQFKTFRARHTRKIPLGPVCQT